MSKENKKLGILAEFDGPDALLNAAENVKKAGYKKFDCHSPFPIHGMDEAMGLKRSPLGWIVGISALTGAALGMLLQWWTSSVDYPLVISGKSFFSYQAFVPVTFGVAVLFGALSAFLGMLVLNKLPRLHHPVFYSDRFEKFSDDGFFLSIDANDPKFNSGTIQNFFTDLNSTNITFIEPDDAKVVAVEEEQ